MQLVLTDADQRRINDAARALLSPLDQPVDRWRSDVLRHLTGIVDTDMGGFLLPAGDDPPYSLQNLPDEFGREYVEGFHSADRSVAAVQQEGSSLWSTRSLLQGFGLSEPDAWFESPEYRNFYSRFGIRDAIGYVVPGMAPQAESGPPGGPGGVPVTALLTCFHHEFGTERFGDAGFARLRLLLPALEAGIAGRVRFAWIMDAMHEAFDVVSDGLQILDADGGRPHMNAALLRMLAEEGEEETLRTAMRRVAGAVRMVLAGTRAEPAGEALETAKLEIRTRSARYALHGHLVGGAPLQAGPMILVSVVRLTRPVPSSPELRDRWGLSRQEARVAQQIARGGSNARIAAELDLSPATARHYTEAVFLKLGVHSRAEAVRRILAD
jgi:DNA-binding NarL/FixJ family response regulator